MPSLFIQILFLQTPNAKSPSNWVTRCYWPPIAQTSRQSRPQATTMALSCTRMRGASSCVINWMSFPCECLVRRLFPVLVTYLCTLDEERLLNVLLGVQPPPLPVPSEPAQLPTPAPSPPHLNQSAVEVKYLTQDVQSLSAQLGSAAR